MPETTTAEKITEICLDAKRAFPIYASATPERRAAFLEAVALNLEANAETLLEVASRETNLPASPRLAGELARTCAQFRMFADLIRSNEWLDVRIVAGDPDRKPIAKPELRRTQVPLGPVAVFGASNFPFAYSVTGGDTASALAAGCPVVVKAHPAHPETSRLCAEAIQKAVAGAGLQTGTFGIVWGELEAGEALVKDPNIAAVGFTGSLKGGRALFDLCTSRPNPIPCYAEMGSVNPVFLLPHALKARSAAIATGFAESLTASMGQFCTNPGVVAGLAGHEFTQFLNELGDKTQGKASGKMLTKGIAKAFVHGNEDRHCQEGVTVVCPGTEGSATIFRVSGRQFLANRLLHEEIFGPSALAVECQDLEELYAVAECLAGQLTATIHFESADHGEVKHLLPLLTNVAGRVIANGFPTGVEVNAAQTHGGPYPATTDSRTTSVGTAAILRFVRPVSYQNFPLDLLPPELQ